MVSAKAWANGESGVVDESEQYDTDAEEGVYGSNSLYRQETESISNPPPEQNWDAIDRAESRKAKRTARAIAHFHTPTLVNLTRLAKARIVRGGRFGLLGNSVMVINARRLLARAPQPSVGSPVAVGLKKILYSGFGIGSSSSAHTAAANVSEPTFESSLAELLEAHAEWLKIVARTSNPDLSNADRSVVVKYHCDLEERAFSDGLPEGNEWSCP